MFRCEGATCLATLHQAPGAVGILIVSGGQDPRAGAHRWQAVLADRLAATGHPVLRFDRRGTGDSDGPRTSFRESAPDLAKAAALLRTEAPNVRRLIGIGNCDGATALALWGRAAGLDGIILLNPWLVPEQDDLPPPAAIRSHYAKTLVDPTAWRRLLTGKMNLGKAVRGLTRATRSTGSPLADEVARSLADAAPPAHIVLAAGDMTAWTCSALLGTRGFAQVRARTRIHSIDTASHSFSAEGDADRLFATVRSAIGSLAQAAVATS